MIWNLPFQMSRAGWRSLLQSFRVLISGELVARVLGFLSIFVWPARSSRVASAS